MGKKAQVVTCGIDKSARVWNYFEKTCVMCRWFNEEVRRTDGQLKVNFLAHVFLWHFKFGRFSAHMCVCAMHVFV